jgi:hypothetical protein
MTRCTQKAVHEATARHRLEETPERRAQLLSCINKESRKALERETESQTAAKRAAA